MRISRTVVIVLAVVSAGVVAFLYIRGTFSGDRQPTNVTQEGIVLTAPEPGPEEITASDSGKAFSYSIGSRFTVLFDSTLYPENALSCAPPNSGVVRVVETAKEARPPLYARTFEVVKAGTCTMTNTRFIAAIVVE